MTSNVAPSAPESCVPIRVLTRSRPGRKRAGDLGPELESADAVVEHHAGEDGDRPRARERRCVAGGCGELEARRQRRPVVAADARAREDRQGQAEARVADGAAHERHVGALDVGETAAVLVEEVTGAAAVSSRRLVIPKDQRKVASTALSRARGSRCLRDPETPRGGRGWGARKVARHDAERDLVGGRRRHRADGKETVRRPRGARGCRRRCTSIARSPGGNRWRARGPRSRGAAQERAQASSGSGASGPSLHRCGEGSKRVVEQTW